MAAAGYYTQLSLVLQRNLYLKWAQRKKTVVEMVMPAFTFALIVILKVLSSAIYIPPDNFPPTELSSLPLSSFLLRQSGGDCVLLYAPVTNASETSEVEQVMKHVTSDLTQSQLDRTVLGLESREAVDEYFTKYMNARDPAIRPVRPWAGIIFETVECGTGPCERDITSVTLRNQTTYVLRLNGSSLPSTKLDKSVYKKAIEWDVAAMESALYSSSGFLTLQHALNTAIFRLRASQSSLSGNDVARLQAQYLSAAFSFQSFPTTGTEASALDEGTLQLIAPLYLVLGFLPLMQKLMYQLVEEKESKRKEAMKVMGLQGNLFILGWIGTYGIVSLCPLLLLIFLTWWGQIMDQSRLLVFAFSLSLFLLSIFAFSFLVSVCFNKAKVAGQVGNLAVLVLLAPRYLLKPHSSAAAISCACLSSPIAFSLIFGILLEPGDALPHPRVGSIIFLLAVDTVIYFTLGYYLDAVLPSQYGVPRSPWFPCRKCRSLISAKSLSGEDRESAELANLFTSATASDVETQDLKLSEAKESKQEQETVASDMGQGSLIMRDLSKMYTETSKEGEASTLTCRCWRVFGETQLPSRYALEGVSMELHRGEILAMIGQNGAGKTTLVNILTGVLTASSGSMLVQNERKASSSVSSDMLREQWGIGLCPQDDILMPELTVRQHLAFFAGLRGMSFAEAQEHIEELASEMDLTAKLDQPHGTLSGGQKKKVSVLVALVGKSQIVCLDEPTAGVDPVSRRAIWRLLQRRKSGRIILLTTHLMDEAELLGDRIAVLSHGRLQVPVSRSLALKERLGIGYLLRCELKKDSADSTQKTQHLRKNVEGLVAGAKHLGSEGTNVTVSENDNLSNSSRDLAHLSRPGSAVLFSLPMDQLSTFPRLFEWLEDTFFNEQVGLASFDISVPSLEEVFLRLSEEGETDEKALACSTTGAAVPVKSLYARFISGKWKSSRPVFLSPQHPLIDRELVDPLMHDELPSNAPRAQGQQELKRSNIQNGVPEYHQHSSYLSGSLLWCRQLFALTQKRLLLMKRQWKALLVTLLIPVLYVSFVFAFTTDVTQDLAAQPPSLALEFQEQPDWYLWSTFPYAASGDQTHLAQSACSAGLVPLWISNGSTSNILQSQFMLDWLAHSQSDMSAMSKPTQVGLAVDYRMVPYYRLLSNISLVHNQAFLLNWLGNHFLRQLDPDLSQKPSEGTCYNQEVTTQSLGWGIQAINHPWPHYEAADLLSSGALVLSVLLGMGFSGLAVLWGSSVMKEQELHILAAQRSLGLFPPVLWLHTLFFDLVMNVLPISLSLILFAVIGSAGNLLLGANTLGTILVFLFSLSAANSQAYLLAAHFLQLPSYQLALSILGTFVSLFLFIVAVVISGIFSRTDSESAFMTSGWMSFLFAGLSPQFGLFWGLLQLGIEASERMHQDSVCVLFGASDCTSQHSVWLVLRPERLGFPLGALFIGTWVYLFARIWYDGWIWPHSVQLTSPPLLSFIAADKADANDSHGAEMNEAARTINHANIAAQTRPSEPLVSMSSSGEVDDSDVKAEEERVKLSLEQTTRATMHSLDPICLFQVRKVFPRKQEKGRLSGEPRFTDTVSHHGRATVNGPTFEVAVGSLSLGVPRGEIFGLLGHNGAGKSTSIGMLSGEVVPTAGRAWLNGKPSAAAPIHSRVGFCRQSGGLQEQLTCYEHLAMGARMRGIEEKEVRRQVQQLLKALNMEEFANRQLMYCSGGTKRKAAVALALLGKPQALLLDEPSAGMDPVSRRKLWHVLRSTSTAGYERSTVLTTHSMTEAESICDRIGILVAGRLRCLGTSQQLKRKYARGYCCSLRTVDTEEAVSAVRAWFLGLFVADRHHNQAVDSSLMGPQLLEEYGGQLRFWIPVGHMKLSALFRELHNAGSRYAIEEYSVYQPSLEQVFLSFARSTELSR